MITVGQTVRFAEPMTEDEANERFVVLELRGDRVLVEFVCEMSLRPQSVYLIEDLQGA